MMRVIVDGHDDRLELRLAERHGANLRARFNSAVNLISEIANRGARTLRFSIRLPHFFDIPPFGALWRLRAKFTHLPCVWETELASSSGALAALLNCTNDLEALFVTSAYIEPQIQIVANDFAKIILRPLPHFAFLLPYPIPSVEFTDDVEQITDVGNAVLEGSGEISLDLVGVSYRNYLRYYIRNMTPGMRLFLSRIVLYHALTSQNLRAARRLTPVVVEENPILRRLQLLLEENIPDTERVMAARLLLKFESDDVVYDLVRRAVGDLIPNWETLLWVERAAQNAVAALLGGVG